MAEEKKARNVAPMDLGKTFVVNGVWMDREWHAEIKAISDQVRDGDLDRYFMDRAASGLASTGKDSHQATVAYGRAVVVRLWGEFIFDQTSDKWRESIPPTICQGIASAIDRVYAMPAPPVELEESEKNV